MANGSGRKTRLSNARIKHGLTQSALAEQIGVDPKTVQHWEQGSQIPRSYALQRLCTILHSTPEALGFSDPRGQEAEEEAGAPASPDASPTRQHSSYCLLLLLDCLLLALVLVAAGVWLV